MGAHSQRAFSIGVHPVALALYVTSFLPSLRAAWMVSFMPMSNDVSPTPGTFLKKYVTPLKRAYPRLAP